MVMTTLDGPGGGLGAAQDVVQPGGERFCVAREAAVTGRERQGLDSEFGGQGQSAPVGQLVGSRLTLR